MAGDFGVGRASEIAHIRRVCSQPQKHTRLKIPQPYNFLGRRPFSTEDCLWGL